MRRAYTDDVDNPSALWSEPGHRLRMEEGETSPLLPLDMLLEEPSPTRPVEPADYDLETGRLNPNQLGPRMRTVYLRNDRTTPPVDDDGDVDQSLEARGQFIPCGCCGKTARFGRTTVQDHQTKGDQPFQALVAKQIQIQPPNANKPTRFAPLRGRKVLVFSDSTASRSPPCTKSANVFDAGLAALPDRLGLRQAAGRSRAYKATLSALMICILPSCSPPRTLVFAFAPSSRQPKHSRVKTPLNSPLRKAVPTPITDAVSADHKMRSENPPQALYWKILSRRSGPVSRS